MADGGTGTPRRARKARADWKPRKKETVQSYGTPEEFLAAVERRFGRIDYDLAAHPGNHVAPLYLDALDDALSRNWSELEGHAFVNPPFEDIYPWAAKCAKHASPRLRITALWVASVDSAWFDDHVLRQAVSCGVTRMEFVGSDGTYPKALVVSSFGTGASGFAPLWKWREETAAPRDLSWIRDFPARRVGEDWALALSRRATDLERRCAMSRWLYAIGLPLTESHVKRWDELREPERKELFAWIRSWDGSLGGSFAERAPKVIG